VQNKDETKKPSITDKELQEQRDRAITYSVDLLPPEEEPSDNKKDAKDDNPSDEVKEHSSAVIAAYLRLGKPYPPLIRKKKKDDPNGRDSAHLTFDTQEEAFTFFQNLAQDNVKFLSFEVDARGNFTGSYYMSTGDGKLHDRKIEIGKIEELSNEFDAFMNANNQNSRNEALARINELTNISPKSTQNWRQEMRNITQSQSQSQEEVQAKEESRTAPTPFKRKLDPY